MTSPGRTGMAFPFRADSRGRTADADYDRHVRDMIELLLFTSPGERVMRPDFGTGLLGLTFGPSSPELAASLHISIQAALQRWLGDVITVSSLDVRSEEGTLAITVAYLVRATGTQATGTFTGSQAS